VAVLFGDQVLPMKYSSISGCPLFGQRLSKRAAMAKDR
jgi:hypothetical protein